MSSNTRPSAIRLPTFARRGACGIVSELVLQVRVHHPEVARLQMPVHFPQRIFAPQTLPKAEAPRLEFVLKDRLDHEFQGRLNYAVLHRRYTERALPLALGYVHASYRLRTIAAVLPAALAPIRPGSSLELARIAPRSSDPLPPPQRCVRPVQPT